VEKGGGGEGGGESPGRGWKKRPRVHHPKREIKMLFGDSRKGDRKKVKGQRSYKKEGGEPNEKDKGLSRKLKKIKSAR